MCNFNSPSISQGNKDQRELELGERMSNEAVDINAEEYKKVQFTTSSRRLDGGAYCVAPVGGKCMVSKAKLVLYAFAV